MNNLLLPSTSIAPPMPLVSISKGSFPVPFTLDHFGYCNVTPFTRKLSTSQACIRPPRQLNMQLQDSTLRNLVLCFVREKYIVFFLADKPSDGCQLQCFLHSPACTLQQQSCKSLKSPTSLKSKLHLSCFYSNNPITWVSIYSSSCSNSTLWTKTTCSL